jgi:hypothetical protein
MTGPDHTEQLQRHGSPFSFDNCSRYRGETAGNRLLRRPDRHRSNVGVATIIPFTTWFFTGSTQTATRFAATDSTEQPNARTTVRRNCAKLRRKGDSG